MQQQPRRASRYVEPFAGGAGVGLRLLFDEYVDEIVLNDLNPGIAAFWRAVFDDSAAFLDLIGGTQPSIEEWYRQRSVYRDPTAESLERGFATFFLNRTNRSGILEARPIGGLDQRGKWLIDARWDAPQLAARIRLLSRYGSRVTICEEDGVGLIARHLKDGDSFVYADPPYLTQGDDLYLDTMRWEDHEALAELLCGSPQGWFLTYDADDRITDVLYPGLRCAQFQTSHTAAKQHVGDEYAVFAQGLRVASLDGLGSGAAAWVAQPS
jgi:DNA adenine methylase